MSRTRRITALALAILAFFIFVGSPFGQSAKAIVGVDDAIIAIVIAALAALGITIVTTAAYGNSREYVGSLMQEYAQYSGTTVVNQLSGVQTGTNRLSQILVNNRFVVYIQGFASWLISKLGLANNGEYVIQRAGVSINGVPSYQLPISFEPIGSFEKNEFFDYVNEAYAVVGYPKTSNSRWQILFWNIEPFTVRSVTTYRNNGGTSSTELNSNLSASGVYYILLTSTVGGYRNQSWSGDYITGAALDELYNSLVTGDAETSVNGAGISIYTGTMVLPQDDADYTEGDGAIIDVGADWGSTYGEVIDGTIPDDFSDGKEGEATITYDSDEAVQEQVEDTPTQTISQEVNDYQSPGLQNVFPFCIPFDIYAFFECLAADPVAPSFTWRFYVPGICDEEIELDLSEFDSVAQIVRTMELLAFIVGLALVTRNRFLRG